MTKCFPIVFTLNDIIAGRGFVARVCAKGRALLTEDEDGFWMDGLNPGAVAAGGEDRDAAFTAFRESYRSVLFDAASAAQDFETFQIEIEEFFSTVSEPVEAEWLEALAAVRSGQCQTDLEAQRAEDYPLIEITTLEAPTPHVNRFDAFAEAA